MYTVGGKCNEILLLTLVRALCEAFPSNKALTICA